MADIELVIKIDEDIYNHIKERYMYSYATDCTTELNRVGFAVRNGIPLPKGHGRLIDAKVAYKKFYSNNMAKVAEEILNEVPTIIEADREDKE